MAGRTRATVSTLPYVAERRNGDAQTALQPGLLRPHAWLVALSGTSEVAGRGMCSPPSTTEKNRESIFKPVHSWLLSLSLLALWTLTLAGFLFSGTRHKASPLERLLFWGSVPCTTWLTVLSSSDCCVSPSVVVHFGDRIPLRLPL